MKATSTSSATSLAKTGQTKGRPPWLRRPAVLGGLAAVVVLGAMAALAGSAARSTDHASGGTALVRRGDLAIVVTEDGSLRAKESVDIINEVEGSSTVAEVVDDGTYVEQGQVLLRLDSKEMEEREAESRSQLRTLEADHKAAVENLSISEDERESVIKQGQQKVEFAGIDLEKYEKGDWPQQQKEALAAIALAEQEMAQNKDTLDWTRKLLAAGVATQEQLRADDLAFQRSEIKWKQEKARLELLVKYEYPKQLKQLKADLDESQRELDRETRRMNSVVNQKTASLASVKDRLDIQTQRYNKLLEQIDKMEIRAPMAGMIVYEPPPRWRNEQVLRVGVSISYRQKLFMLPDLSQMEVDVRIHETQVERVQPGQRATITVDAFPDLKLTGEVKRIAVMADSQRWFNPDVKVYLTVVSIDQQTEGLKPGMSAKVRIACKVLKDELLVPVTGVQVLRGRDAAIVKTGSGYEVREVTIGETDDQFIVIKAGLEEGDEVLLYKPKVMPEIPWPEPKKEVPQVGTTPVEPDVPGPNGTTGPEAPRSDPSRDRQRNLSPEERERRLQQMRERQGTGGDTGGAEGGGRRSSRRAPQGGAP